MSMRGTQRRRLLQLMAGGVVSTSWGPFDRARASASAEPSSEEESSFDSDDFDPGIHGFGFPNWAGGTGEEADGKEFTYESGDVTQADVRRAIDDSWRTALSETQELLMTRIISSWIGKNAATNGHCYGMVFSAENYFRNPSELPDGVDSASEIPRPADEYDDVGDLIRWFQTSQILQAEVFWYAFFGLRWGLADRRESLRQLTDAVDTTGTAALTFGGEAQAHQVLAYEYERSDGIVDVSVYDPNHEAADHRNSNDIWTLSVEHESGDILEIKDGYNDFIYHHPDMDLSAVDRMVGGHDRVLDKLSNAVFLGLESGGELEIDVPDDVLVDRPAAEYADPDGAPYVDAAVVFDFPEEFDISIDGPAEEEYSLDTLCLREGDIVLEEVVSDTFDEVPARLRFMSNQAEEPVIDAVEDIEETAAEDEEEASDGVDWVADNWWIPAAGGAIGLGAAYRLLARRTEDEDEV